MSKKNLSENLKKLSAIAEWFDEVESLDIEEGLEKVKQAVSIIKDSKAQLKEVENQFEKIKSEIKEDLLEK